jgi:hypothetical protein
VVTDHRFTINDGDPYFVSGPVHLARFTMRAGDFAISADDFRGAELRPGDAITVEMAGGKARIMRTRQRPWWRRWPWARTERTVLREFDWQRRPRRRGQDAPMTGYGAQADDDFEFRNRYSLPNGFRIGWDHGGPKPDGVWTRAYHVPAAPLALPPGESAARLALPWGDSAYTSISFPRWLPGGPADRDPRWGCGPPSNGLTPSGEGPRREAEALTRALRNWDRERRQQWETAIGERPWNPPHLPFEPGTRVGWQDEHGVVHTGTVDDHHPIGFDGWEMHVTWDRDEDR